LGSGKTSLLKHIARRHGEKKIAFVVNEFSMLDADGFALKQEYEKVICLPGGSVFCRCLSGQFIQTLRELPDLLELPQCDGVVVEASGIADPAVAPQMLREAKLDRVYRMSRIIAVVEPGNIADLLEQLPNTRSQLLAADDVIINKIDIYDAKTVGNAAALVRSINDHAVIVKAVFCQTPLELFEGSSIPKTSGGYAERADPNFVTATATTETPVDVNRLLRAINTLRDDLYRAKGFLASADGAVYLDWTPSTCSRFDLPGHIEPLGFALIGNGKKAPAINALAARLQSGAFSLAADGK